jgi:hypothetical protein
VTVTTEIQKSRWTGERIARLGFLLGLGWDAKRPAGIGRARSPSRQTKWPMQNSKRVTPSPAANFQSRHNAPAAEIAQMEAAFRMVAKNSEL